MNLQQSNFTLLDAHTAQISYTIELKSVNSSYNLYNLSWSNDSLDQSVKTINIKISMGTAYADYTLQGTTIITFK